MKAPGPNHITVVQHHYHQAPQTAHRPSHYVPQPMQDSGLGEVARWGLASFTALFVALILGTAIASWGNATYWQSERQHQRIYNHPAGGQW